MRASAPIDAEDSVNEDMMDDDEKAQARGEALTEAGNEARELLGSCP